MNHCCNHMIAGGSGRMRKCVVTILSTSLWLGGVHKLPRRWRCCVKRKVSIIQYSRFICEVWEVTNLHVFHYWCTWHWTMDCTGQYNWAPCKHTMLWPMVPITVILWKILLQISTCTHFETWSCDWHMSVFAMIANVNCRVQNLMVYKNVCLTKNLIIPTVWYHAHTVTCCRNQLLQNVYGVQGCVHVTRWWGNKVYCQCSHSDLTSQMYYAFKQCKQLGALAQVHAENGDLIVEVHSKLLTVLCDHNVMVIGG